MEQTAEAVKALILGGVNAELPALEDAQTTLPAIAEKNVVVGTVDLSRYEAPVVVSVLPDKTQPDDETIDGFSDSESLVVTFLFQKAKYPLLVKRMFRYAEAFRRAQAKDAGLSGAADDSRIGEVDYFPDTGPGGQTLTACEIELSAKTSEKVKVNPHTGI